MSGPGVSSILGVSKKLMPSISEEFSDYPAASIVESYKAKNLIQREQLDKMLFKQRMQKMLRCMTFSPNGSIRKCVSEYL